MPTHAVHPTMQIYEQLPYPTDDRLCIMEMDDTHGLEVVDTFLVSGLVIP